MEKTSDARNIPLSPPSRSTPISCNANDESAPHFNPYYAHGDRRTLRIPDSVARLPLVVKTAAYRSAEATRRSPLQGLMSAVAKGNLGAAFALAEGVAPGLGDDHLDGLELRLSVGPVAPRLVLGPAAATPPIGPGLELEYGGFLFSAHRFVHSWVYLSWLSAACILRGASRDSCPFVLPLVVDPSRRQR